MNKWRAVVYNGQAWVFRNGALLDACSEKFSVRGGLFAAERLAALLNGGE